MKAKVRLSYVVECVVEGEDEDVIMDWLYQHTPSELHEEAIKNGNSVEERYEEGIIKEMPAYTKASIKI